MKTYLIYSTTEDDWEWGRAADLVVAESKEEAMNLFKLGFSEISIDEVIEIDLTVKGQIRISDSIVE